MAIGRCSEGEKPPLVILPELIAFAVEDQRAFAHRLAALDLEADAQLRRAVEKLGEDPHRPGKPAFGAAALVDGEIEAGHDRRGRRVEVVAVERKPGLEPQRIAGAEADRLDQLAGAERIGQRPRRQCRARKSRTRLRRYSRSG